MNINVTKDAVTITTDQLHKGEYNINQVSFTFSQEYTNDLVKKVIFTDPLGEHYSVTIMDNKATIPYEILIRQGKVLIGVYAYEMEDDELVLRYSPKPAYVTIEQGSWVDSQDGETVVPNLTMEQYEQALNEILQQWHIDSEVIMEQIDGKITEFNNNATEKTNAYNQNANEKIQEFDTHANLYQKTWHGTQAQYDTLTKDENTQYFIEEA